MSVRQHFARRFRYQRFLQTSLVLGGSFNIALGVLLGLAPAPTLGILGLARPVPGFYLDLLAVLAALVGCYYLLAASDIRRHSGIVALAIAGRLCVALVLTLAALRATENSGLGVLALVEALLGASHAVSWWSIRS